MDENTQGIAIFCEKHAPPEDAPEILVQAVTHALMQGVFQSEEFLTIIAKAMEGRKFLSTTETQTLVTDVWIKDHPYACCFFTDREYINIISKEVTKILLFGTEDVPLFEPTPLEEGGTWSMRN